MEIKCNFHPKSVNNFYTPNVVRETEFRGRENVLLRKTGESADKFVRRPVATKSATGLHGLREKTEQLLKPIVNSGKEYIHNIQHTYEHKIVFAMIEKEIFGSNSLDSITHDLDKLILYTLGFKRPFVSRFHRFHSEHHQEYCRLKHKKPNLRSMLCDNIASSPEFKPEKKLSLREYYQNSPELQGVNGFGDLLEKYNFGENLDFTKIKFQKKQNYANTKGLLKGTAKILPLLISNFI